jgi:hypothetical protein
MVLPQKCSMTIEGQLTFWLVWFRLMLDFRCQKSTIVMLVLPKLAPGLR